MAAVGNSYAFDVVVDSDGKPTGVSNVTAGFTKAVISGVTGIVTGGESACVGTAHTVLEVAKSYASSQLSNKLQGQELRLNPYSAG